MTWFRLNKNNLWANHRFTQVRKIRARNSSGFQEPLSPVWVKLILSLFWDPLMTPKTRNFLKLVGLIFNALRNSLKRFLNFYLLLVRGATWQIELKIYVSVMKKSSFLCILVQLFQRSRSVEPTTSRDARDLKVLVNLPHRTKREAKGSWWTKHLERSERLKVLG